jgi:hypothetical protein
MRPRRWILALLLIPALLLAGTLAAWRLLGLEESLRRQVVELLAGQGLEDVRLSAVRPAWLGLDLRGLGFTRPGGGLRLECRTTRLRLNPLAWLARPDQALSAVAWVELRDFRLQADPGLLARDPATPPAPPFHEWLRTLSPALSTLPEIRLRGGSLVWRDVRGGERVLLHHLEGLVLRVDGRVELILRSGLAGGGEEGAGAGLTLDPATLDGRFHVNVDSLGLELARPAGLGLLERAAGFGRLDLGGRLRAARLDSLGGGARLVLREARLGGLPDPLDAWLELRLDRDSVRVSRGRLERRGEGLNITGALPWRLQGAWLGLQGRKLDLARQLADLPGATQGGWDRLEGLLDLDVAGRWQDGPRWSGRAELRGAGLAGRPLGEVDLAADGDDRDLRIRRLDWRPRTGLGLSATGGVRDLAARAALSLQVLVEATPAGLPGLDELGEGAHARADLLLEARRGGAGWRIETCRVDGRLLRGEESLLSVVGGVVPGAWPAQGWPATHLRLLLPGGRELGQWSWLGGTGREWSLALAGQARDLAPLLGLRAAGLHDELGGELRLAGSGLDTRLEADLDWRGRQARLEGRLTWQDSLRALEAGLVLEGWRGSRLEGRLEARLAERRIQVDLLQLEDLVLHGWLEPDSRRYWVELSGDDIPLQPVWDLLMEDPAPAELGKLTLLAAGEGSLDQPALRGGVEWRQRWRGRQARLRADLELDSREARVARGQLNVDGVDWAGLEAVWSLAVGPRELELKLVERDLAELMAPGDAVHVGGRVRGMLRADLASTGGGVVAQVSVDAPRWKGLSFERLDLRAHPGNQPGTLSLDSLVLVRGGKHPLRLEARGIVPLGRGDLDLELLAEGDFLQPLMVTAQGRPSGFFRKAGGQGKARLLVGGSLVDPQLRTGMLELRGGQLEMASIFHRVRDLELLLTIQGGRLTVERGEARVGDARLLIGNTWEAEGPDGPLEPWVLERPGLDCGILTLSTLGRRGQLGPVELNLPGLMEPDWSALVQLSGSRPGQPFVLAGPLERPMLSGRALVDHAEFTYPFIKGTGPRTPLLQSILGFLERMEWDLFLDAGRQVNYWRKVQGFDDTRFVDRLAGYLDRITVDLYLDPTRQPVHFSGQIEDESFRVEGEVGCSRGSVVFLDKEFDVEEAGLVFDASSLMPMVWGRAEHTLAARETDPGLQGLFGEDARQVWLQLRTDDELGNRQLRGRWDEIRVELVDDLNSSQNLLERGQEELLVDMGINPYDPGGSIESMLPDVVAGFWEIPLRPIESRLRRRLGLDEVRIFLPVLRNTVGELLATQTRSENVSQSYLDYLQGSRVTLGKSLGPRTFASWTGQLVASTPVEDQALVRIFQRLNLDYEVSRNLNLSGELVFDPLREEGALRGDPRILLRYRQKY